ncbi:MAG: DUF4823 domain-containing protein [Desulfotalea sp.]
MKQILLLLLLSPFLFGCADSTRIIQDEGYKDIALSNNSVVYVSIPKDGRYGSNDYPGSGQSVSSITKAALLKHIIDVHEGSAYETYNEALKSATASDTDYLFFQQFCIGKIEQLNGLDYLIKLRLKWL